MRFPYYFTKELSLFSREKACNTGNYSYICFSFSRLGGIPPMKFCENLHETLRRSSKVKILEI